jgi:hypothetical protein
LLLTDARTPETKRIQAQHSTREPAEDEELDILQNVAGILLDHIS